MVILKKIFILVVLLFFVSSGLVQAAPLSNDELRALNLDNTWYTTKNTSGCSAPAGPAISNTLPATIPTGYATLFNKAAVAYKINPQFLAALFMNEHSNTWLPFDSDWASSPKGASGPFQFMPGTWDGYKVDGNNDGKIDIQNIYDSAFAAANMINKAGVNASTPLGDIAQPFKPGTFLYFAAGYNWGPSNVQSRLSANSPLSAAPDETSNYVSNTYLVISSGFTKGSARNGPVKDQTNGKTVSTDSGPSAAGSSCSDGVVAGSIVNTALNLAWDSGGHSFLEASAKPTYRTAMPQFNGATADKPFSDCGVYISTIMIASGADKEFPKRLTTNQRSYLASSNKYTEIKATTSADLAPGDIFVNSSHIYMFVGPQPKGFSIVAASLGDHVPEAGHNAYFYQNGNTGEAFRIFRLTNGAAQ